MNRRWNRWVLTLWLTLPAVLPGCDAIQPLPQEVSRPVVEAAVFEGGYGVHWHKAIARQYENDHPNIAVNLWGDPRVVEKVKPRILRGDPPDFMLMQDLPIWQLIAADKLLPFDEYLDQPAYGSSETWRSLFIPGTLDTYQTEGKTYAIPSAFGAWACWYDARLFREHGWEVPKTWAEFEALCNEIKAAGIAPIAFQGKYPYYGWWSLISIIQRCGGLAAVNRINAMEPGALTHPDVVWSAEVMQQMSLKYFQKGFSAMTHTESQLQFVNNNAALIFCGLWLYNEMKDSIPPGFEMRCFTVPQIEKGKGSVDLFNGSGWEFIFVPRDARFPEEAFDFARYAVSPMHAPGMAKAIGVISPLRHGTPRDSVAPPLQSALDMIENARGIFTIRLDMLLLAWRTQVMEPAMAGLLSGDIDPETFCRILDQGIQDALRDPDVIVPPAQMYDPAAYGETP